MNHLVPAWEKFISYTEEKQKSLNNNCEDALATVSSHITSRELLQVPKQRPSPCILQCYHSPVPKHCLRAPRKVISCPPEINISLKASAAVKAKDFVSTMLL